MVKGEEIVLGMLLMGFLLYLAIVGGFSAVSFLFGSAFEAGGWLGVIGVVAWIFFWMWVASETCGDKGKKK